MSRIIDSGADMTMFGQVINLEKKIISLNNGMCSDIESIKDLQGGFTQMEKEAKTTTNEAKIKLLEEVKKAEDRIRNYLNLQKIENLRFANQIVQMSQHDKQIASQLDFLQTRFQEFEKNVYGSKNT